MKRCFVLLALLLFLPAPCLAQGVSSFYDSFGNVISQPEIHRLHPGGAYIDTRQKYEHKIIPEAELEGYLNQGWECDRVYTIMLDGRGMVDKYGPYPPGGKPLNKAIIRRAK